MATFATDYAADTDALERQRLEDEAARAAIARALETMQAPAVPAVPAADEGVGMDFREEVAAAPVPEPAPAPQVAAAAPAAVQAPSLPARPAAPAAAIPAPIVQPVARPGQAEVVDPLATLRRGVSSKAGIASLGQMRAPAETQAKALPAIEGAPASMTAPGSSPALATYESDIVDARERDLRRQRAARVLRVLGAIAGLIGMKRGGPVASAMAALPLQVVGRAIDESPRLAQQATQDYGIRSTAEQADANRTARLLELARRQAADEQKAALAEQSMALRGRQVDINEETAGAQIGQMEARRQRESAQEVDRAAYESDPQSAMAQERRDLASALLRNLPEGMENVREEIAAALPTSTAQNIDENILPRLSQYLGPQRGGRGAGGSSGGGGGGGGSGGAPDFRAVELAQQAVDAGMITQDQFDERVAQMEALGSRALETRHRALAGTRLTAQARDADQTRTEVRELSRAMSGVSEWRSAIGRASQLFSRLDDATLRLLLLGGDNVPAGWRTSDWDAARRTFQNMRMQRGKQLSGSAVSDTERAMIDAAMNAERTTDPRSFRDAVNELHRERGALDNEILSGYSQDAVTQWRANMAALRGQPSGGQAQRPAQSQQGGLRDVMVTVNGQTARRRWTEEQIQAARARGYEVQ